MTDVVAQNLFVDGMVAKAPNVALVYEDLPIFPEENDMAIYAGQVFRGTLGWDAGVLPPLDSFGRELIEARGVSGAPNGDIVLAARPSTGVLDWTIYRLSNGIWDSGLTTPVPSHPVNGVVVRENGNIAALLTLHQDPIHEYSGSAWDGGSPGPAGTALSLSGISEDSSGNLVVVSGLTQLIYTRDEATHVWDSGFSIPSDETRPRGVAAGNSGEYYVGGADTHLIYKRTAGVWDAGIVGPLPSRNIEGLGIQPNGNLVTIGLDIRVHTLFQDNATLPTARGLVRWTGTQWENL